MKILKPAYKIAVKRTLKVLYFLLWGIALFSSCSGKKDDRRTEYSDLMKSEELTKEALSESWNLLQQGQQLADAGKSIQEILKTLPDSTIVQTNASAILFFIKSSIPMMIELPKEEGERGITKGGGNFIKSQKMQPTTLFSSLTTTSYLEDNELLDVVASEKGEDEREDKKALILAPFLSEFGNNDDGLIAQKYLEKNKNYKGGVDFRAENIDINDYKNFASYDLVHLSTHGERFCGESLIKLDGGIELFDSEQDDENDASEMTFDESEVDVIEQEPIVVTDIQGNEIANYDDIVSYSYGCRTIVKTGINHDLEDKSEEEIIQFLEKFQDDSHLIVVTTTSVGLKSNFFDFYYGGLKDKIWIFSACELGQLGDLGETMKNIHINGHFFYWLNTVFTVDAKPAFEKFYENLVKEGLDAKIAFEKIPENLRIGLRSEFEDPNINNGEDVATTTSLLHLQTGERRHGIEVIEMKHPEKKDKTIKDGDFYPLVGDFGDGQDEAITLKVELRGYSKSEFEEKQMTISLKVDDEIVLSKKRFLPDEEDDGITIKPIEDHEYGIEVTIADIEISDVGDKEELTLKAILHLNEENFSIHKERVTIKADGIEATIFAGGKKIVFTYDDKKRALRIETPEAPSDIYMDEKGYMYVKPPNMGWKKVNLSMAKGMSQMIPAELGSISAGLENTLSESVSDNNFFFPIVEWGIRFRMRAFENNSNFKKELTDCEKPQPCHKFIGTQGQEKGVHATFDPGGKLREIKFKNSGTVTYKYGEYNVVVPTAEPIF